MTIEQSSIESSDAGANVPDVQFDHGRAASLAGALRNAAFWVDQLADARHEVWNRALADAEGPWADALRRTVSLEGRRCQEIAERLRVDAGRVDDAAIRARDEQHRRERERQAANSIGQLLGPTAPLASS